MCYNKTQAQYIMENLTEADFDDELNQIFAILKAMHQSGATPDARLIVSSFPNTPLAAEVLHDDKNIDDVQKATKQSIEIIISYNKTKILQNALKNDGLSSYDKLNQINEVLSNKGKGGENDSEQ